MDGRPQQLLDLTQRNLQGILLLVVIQVGMKALYGITDGLVLLFVREGASNRRNLLEHQIQMREACVHDYLGLLIIYSSSLVSFEEQMCVGMQSSLLQVLRGVCIEYRAREVQDDLQGFGLALAELLDRRVHLLHRLTTPHHSDDGALACL